MRSHLAMLEGFLTALSCILWRKRWQPQRGVGAVTGVSACCALCRAAARSGRVARAAGRQGPGGAAQPEKAPSGVVVVVADHRIAIIGHLKACLARPNAEVHILERRLNHRAGSLERGQP